MFSTIYKKENRWFLIKMGIQGGRLVGGVYIIERHVIFIKIMYKGK